MQLRLDSWDPGLNLQSSRASASKSWRPALGLGVNPAPDWLVEYVETFAWYCDAIADTFHRRELASSSRCVLAAQA